MSEPICTIVNKCINDGIFPDLTKKVKIIAIYKEVDRNMRKL